jgi:hypothetical protein
MLPKGAARVIRSWAYLCPSGRSLFNLNQLLWITRHARLFPSRSLCCDGRLQSGPPIELAAAPRKVSLGLGRPCFLSPNGMANKHRAGRRFAETPLNLTEAERSALIAYIREAINRDSTGPRLLTRVKRLKRLFGQARAE